MRPLQILILILSLLFFLSAISILAQQPTPTPPAEPQTDISMPHETVIPLGQLTIESKPAGAKIFLNDQPINLKTPYTITDLAPGKYKIKLKMRNHGTVNQYIKVNSNQTTTVLVELPTRNSQVGTSLIISALFGATVGVLIAFL